MQTKEEQLAEGQVKELAALKEWIKNGQHCYPCFSRNRTRQSVWTNLTVEEQNKILEEDVRNKTRIDPRMQFEEVG